MRHSRYRLTPMFPHFSHDPMPFQAAPDLDLLGRLRLFLGHYDLRVYVSDTHYVDVGRGSLGAVLRIVQPMSKLVNQVASVGQFCDFNGSCQIFVASEHKNALPVNVVFSNTTPLLVKAAELQLDDLRATRPEPITVGNAVVVSAEAKLFPGARVGDGAVIAGGAVVLGEVDAFGVGAGIPARTVKQRCDDATRQALQQVRWWDFDMAYLSNNLSRLQSLAVDVDAAHVYRQAAPRIVLRLAQGPKPEVKIVGFVDGGQLKPIGDAPAKVRNYLAQIGSAGPHYWLADAWRAD